MRTTRRELACEVRGPDRIRERDRRVGVTGVGHVGEQRDRGVAGEEEVVQVVRTVEALELVGGVACRRYEIADHRDRLGRVGPPRARRHHVMGVHVDDQLAVRAEHRLARGGVERVRDRRTGRRDWWWSSDAAASAPGVGAAGVEHRQAQRDTSGRLQEPTARHARGRGPRRRRGPGSPPPRRGRGPSAAPGRTPRCRARPGAAAGADPPDRAPDGAATTTRDETTDEPSRGFPHGTPTPDPV